MVCSITKFSIHIKPTLNLLLQLTTNEEFSLTRCLNLLHLAMQVPSLVKLMCQTFVDYYHKLLPPHLSLPLQKSGSMMVLQTHYLAGQSHHLEQAFQAWTTKAFRIISTKQWDLVQLNVNFTLQERIIILHRFFVTGIASFT